MSSLPPGHRAHEPRAKDDGPGSGRPGPGTTGSVYAIVGTVMASKGRRVGLPVIPFLRAPRG